MKNIISLLSNFVKEHPCFVLEGVEAKRVRLKLSLESEPSDWLSVTSWETSYPSAYPETVFYEVSSSFFDGKKCRIFKSSIRFPDRAEGKALTAIEKLLPTLSQAGEEAKNTIEASKARLQPLLDILEANKISYSTQISRYSLGVSFELANLAALVEIQHKTQSIKVSFTAKEGDDEDLVSLLGNWLFTDTSRVLAAAKAVVKLKDQEELCDASLVFALLPSEFKKVNYTDFSLSRRNLNFSFAQKELTIFSSLIGSLKSVELAKPARGNEAL